MTQMKNRAKCKKCHSIIESFHSTDYVLCKCGEIAIDGGEALLCYAIDFSNFLRVDDEGREIIVSLKGSNVKQLYTESKMPTKQELLSHLKDMIDTYERLPEMAKYSPITHYDHLSLLLLLSAIFRADCKDES